MRNQTSSHFWLRGGERRERLAALPNLELPPALVPPVDSHRRRRGPYTAAGTIARALVPDLLTRHPDAVRRHDREVLSVAPELRSSLPNSRAPLTSMGIPTERTRFCARLRTKSISSGLVELLRETLPEGERRTLVFENVEHAEQTDIEFLTALLRHADPECLTVVICTPDRSVADAGLRTVLDTLTRVHTVPTSQPSHAALSTWVPPRSRSERRAQAWRYISSDCTSDDAPLRRAYEELHPADMAQLHQRRADELAALGEQSLALGAIPFHLTRGCDPRGAGVQALRAAQHHCLVQGFFSAVVEYGYQGLELVDRRRDPDQWWLLVVELGLALSLLSRTREAEELYNQARLLSTPHHDVEDRHDRVADAWLHAAQESCLLRAGL